MFICVHLWFQNLQLLVRPQIQREREFPGPDEIFPIDIGPGVWPNLKEPCDATALGFIRIYREPSRSPAGMSNIIRASADRSAGSDIDDIQDQRGVRSDRRMETARRLPASARRRHIDRWCRWDEASSRPLHAMSTPHASTMPLTSTCTCSTDESTNRTVPPGPGSCPAHSTVRSPVEAQLDPALLDRAVSGKRNSKCGANESRSIG